MFAEFLKHSETPMGTAVSDTVIVSDIEDDNEDVIENVNDIVFEDVNENVNDVDNENNIVNDIKQFKVNCYVPVPKIPDVEDLSSYLKRINRI